MRRLLVFMVCLALLTALPLFAQADPVAGSQSALDFIAAQPDDVAVLCIPSDAAGEIAHNAEVPFALASTFKIIVLAELARQLDAGLIDPDEAVSVSEVDAYWLPATDGGGHPQFISFLGAERETATLREIAYGMIRFSSNAAADYLTVRLGYDGYAELYQTLGLESTQFVTGTLLGLYLVLENHETGPADVTALDAETFAAESTRLTDLFLNDPTWRTFELADLGARQTAAQAAVAAGDLALIQAEYDRQAAFVERFGIRGSARDMLRVMAAAYGGETFSDEAQALMRGVLNWLMDLNPANREVYSHLGNKGGSWASVLTGTWYAQPIGAEPTLLAVFYRNLPLPLWSNWLSNGAHQLLELRAFAFGEGCGVFAAALGQ
ncbi:MAG: serine hydrolase [Chloroflexota bacterium]|nr:serine hydrolase [Chloroflexota bacterium]